METNPGSTTSSAAARQFDWRAVANQLFASQTDEPLDLAYYAQKKAEWYNREPGTLTGYDCPICLNRGNVMVADGERTVIRRCKCMNTRASLKRLAESGLADLVRDSKFGTFQTPEPWQVEAKRLAIDYATQPEGWFVAMGNPGSGKTHLCVAICRKLLLDGRDCRYMRWRDDSTRIKAAIKDPAEYARLVDPLKNVSVLYIDDFFKTGKQGEKPTTADVNLAFEILNARYVQRSTVTILSTERTMPELCEIDEAVGSRIYERCRSHRLEMRGIDKNWRLKQ